MRLLSVTAIIVLTTIPALAQNTVLKNTADQDDVSSPEAIVMAAYEAIAREPGGQYDWNRFRSLFIPQARLIPNMEQSGGQFRVLSPQEFTDWIDSVTTIGGPNDAGFVEAGVKNIVEQYGDVAHVFSTYEKHLWGQDEVIGGGINSFQLVHNGGRWWITGIVWDEPTGAGPIPAKYQK